MLSLNYVVAAKTLGLDQLNEVVNRIEFKEADPDWAQNYRQKLGLSAQALEEWSRQKYKTGTRQKVVKALKKAMGADLGVDERGREI